MTELSSVRLVTYSRRSWFSVQKEWLTLEAGVVFLSNPFHSCISPIDLWLKISRLLNRNLPMAESDILHIVVTQHYRAPEAQFPSHIVHIPPFYHLKSRRRWNSEIWACACGVDKKPSIISFSKSFSTSTQLTWWLHHLCRVSCQRHPTCQCSPSPYSCTRSDNKDHACKARAPNRSL